MVGAAVSTVLDMYMQWIYDIAWPVVKTLNHYGLYVRRYQMAVILSLTMPAVVTGALGFVLGRLCRRK